MREILASLDIGSSKIKLVVAEILGDSLNVLCAIDEDSRGVKNGTIVEPDETEYAIKKLLKRAEELLGVKVSKVITTVSEEQADFKVGEAQIDIKDDMEVNANNIQRVLQTSSVGKVDKGNELVTIIPIMFKVDGNKYRLPLGVKGESLQVKSVIVSVPKKDVYLIAKILEKCSVDVVDVMIPSIGSYYAHKNVSTDNSVGIVCDVGGQTINIGVFNKGIIINNMVLPYGGDNVDNDISFIYKIDNKESKKIKETFALANNKNASQKENMEIVNNQGEKMKVNQYEVSQVCMSRLQEILNKAKNEIR